MDRRKAAVSVGFEGYAGHFESVSGLAIVSNRSDCVNAANRGLTKYDERRGQAWRQHQNAVSVHFQAILDVIFNYCVGLNVGPIPFSN